MSSSVKKFLFLPILFAVMSVRATLHEVVIPDDVRISYNRLGFSEPEKLERQGLSVAWMAVQSAYLQQKKSQNSVAYEHLKIYFHKKIVLGPTKPVRIIVMPPVPAVPPLHTQTIQLNKELDEKYLAWDKAVQLKFDKQQHQKQIFTWVSLRDQMVSHYVVCLFEESKYCNSAAYTLDAGQHLSQEIMESMIHLYRRGYSQEQLLSLMDRCLPNAQQMSLVQKLRVDFQDRYFYEKLEQDQQVHDQRIRNVLRRKDEQVFVPNHSACILTFAAYIDPEIERLIPQNQLHRH
jgi:hypothetical protein